MPSMEASFRRQQPLVKVRVEPVHARDLAKLERGLRLLRLSDAGVQVTDDAARGELLLACRGELHLEQSLVDLQTKLLAEPVELRVSDPIVDFGESTDWMEQETEHFAVFVDAAYGRPVDSGATSNAGRPRAAAAARRVPAPARQSSLPPYNEEEGLGSAAYGRSRSFLTGRGAAVRLRAVPLAPIVFRAMSERSVVDGCEADLAELGRALGAARGASPEELLDALCNRCLFLSDDSGSAMVETPALSTGWCVRGVAVADEGHRGELYVPPLAAASGPPTDSSPNGNVDDDDALLRHKRRAYDSLTERIRERGFREAGAAPDDDRGLGASGGEEPPGGEGSDEDAADAAARGAWVAGMRGSAVAGFQLALRSGPLCEEPVRGVLVVLEGVEVAVVAATKTRAAGESLESAEGEEGPSYAPSKPLQGGMVVSAVRSGIRCALLTRPARLVEGILRLTLHSSLSGLGSLYGVLSKRRGRVAHDSTVDGTDLLLIEALIPAAEAFGLAPELFGRTSGEVTAPEMVFSHWERLDVDPFWIPTSLEEREDYGELQSAGDSSTGLDNPALGYIRQVRRRKGLAADSSRTVVAAEKQRTLKR
jgi:ribosome assembly protein 1